MNGRSGSGQMGRDCPHSVPCEFGWSYLGQSELHALRALQVQADGRSSSVPIVRLGLPAHRALSVQADERSCLGWPGLPAHRVILFGAADGLVRCGWVGTAHALCLVGSGGRTVRFGTDGIAKANPHT